MKTGPHADTGEQMRAAKGHLPTGRKIPVPHMTQHSINPQSLYKAYARPSLGTGLPRAGHMVLGPGSSSLEPPQPKAHGEQPKHPLTDKQ